MNNIRKFSKTTCVLACFTFLMTACNDYEVPESPEFQKMMTLLAEKSPTKTISGLQLPAAYDFNAIPQDPRNPITKSKVELGKLLFHETALAINPENTISMNTYSCASCHHAGAGFQSGIKQGIGDGGEAYGYGGEGRVRNVNCPEDKVDVQPLKSPSVLNIAYQTNVLWNGQFGAGNANNGTEAQWTEGTPIAVNKLGYQGVETQAIAGFTVHRMGLNKELLSSEPYTSLFQKAFPSKNFFSMTDEDAKEVIGLAIAAYERTVVSDLSPYQLYLKGEESSLSNNEKEGLKLFFGKAECYKCHNGPALSSMEFHALAFPDMNGKGVIDLKDENAPKGRGSFTKNSLDDYKFKVPQLYNLKEARFFGHGSSFGSVEDVVRYKNIGVSANGKVPQSQLSPMFKPLNLTNVEVQQLVEFIENGLSDPDLRRYEPTVLPSGNCFPNNDQVSKKQICD